MKILKNYEKISINDFEYDDYYFLEENAHVRFYSSSMFITDLTNAMKVGKIVKNYYIYNSQSMHDDGFKLVLSNYLTENNLTLPEFISNVLVHGLKDSDILKIKLNEKKGIHVFSPFVKQKKIEVPTQWRTSHIIKGIMSGQIYEGECILSLTDDFYGDYKDNYGKGPIKLLNLCKDLVEESSGWRVMEDEQLDNGIIKIRVNLYSFNKNIVTFDYNRGPMELELDSFNKGSIVIDLAEYRVKKGV